MKIIVDQITLFDSLSGAKGSVRMSPEKIKKLIVHRKEMQARLAKVKKPTDKTKARIERNKGHLATLGTKLKIAVKQAKTNAKGGTSDGGSKSEPKAKTSSMPQTKHAQSDKVLRRVNAARKAYTHARLNGNLSASRIESLKHRYTSAFRSYMQLAKEKDTSTSAEEFAPGTAGPKPGRMDPVVLAYNHIMSLSSSANDILACLSKYKVPANIAKDAAPALEELGDALSSEVLDSICSTISKCLQLNQIEIAAYTKGRIYLCFFGHKDLRSVVPSVVTAKQSLRYAKATLKTPFSPDDMYKDSVKTKDGAGLPVIYGCDEDGVISIQYAAA